MRGFPRSPIGAVAVAALASCGTGEVPPAIDRPPTTTPLPVAIGIYYPPEFRTARCELTITGLAWDPMSSLVWSARQVMNSARVIGPAQIAAFDLVWPAMFDHVVPLEAPIPPASAPGEVAAVITPAVADCTIRNNANDHSADAQIEYRFTLSTPAGEPIATWSVVGRPPTAETIWSGSGPLLRAAMRDAVAKFVVGFDAEPALGDWRARLPTLAKVQQ